MSERDHRMDADFAVSILTAARQDLTRIYEAIPVSKRGSRLKEALESLERRIAAGEELWEERNAV